MKPGCSGTRANWDWPAGVQQKHSAGLGGLGAEMRDQAMWKLDVARQVTIQSRKPWLEVPKR